MRSPRSSQFLRFWELFSLILPRKARIKVFKPHYNEFKEDYLLAYCRYKSKWAKRWLNFCFTFRTVCMIVDCFRVSLGAKVWQLLLATLLPEPARKFLRAILVNRP